MLHFPPDLQISKINRTDLCGTLISCLLAWRFFTNERIPAEKKMSHWLLKLYTPRKVTPRLVYMTHISAGTDTFLRSLIEQPGKHHKKLCHSKQDALEVAPLHGTYMKSKYMIIFKLNGI